MSTQKFSLRNRLKSFGFAVNGIGCFIKSEHNAWLHVIATILVLAFSVIVRLSHLEFVAIAFAIGLVWVTEIINTVVEKLLDHLSPAYHTNVKIIKDMAAGAVLVAAITALTIALLIFIPKLL